MTSIESFMSKDVATVDANVTVRAASKLMRDRNLGALVVTAEGKIHGVFSERDLLNRVVADEKDIDGTKVAEVCTTNPVTVSANEEVEACYRLIREKGFRHLPIHDGEGHAIGIVSSRDFLRCLIMQAEGEFSMEEVCAKLGQLTGIMKCMEELPGTSR